MSNTTVVILGHTVYSNVHTPREKVYADGNRSSNYSLSLVIAAPEFLKFKTAALAEITSKIKGDPAAAEKTFARLTALERANFEEMLFGPGNRRDSDHPLKAHADGQHMLYLKKKDTRGKPSLLPAEFAALGEEIKSGSLVAVKLSIYYNDGKAQSMNPLLQLEVAGVKVLQVAKTPWDIGGTSASEADFKDYQALQQDVLAHYDVDDLNPAASLEGVV